MDIQKSLDTPSPFTGYPFPGPVIVYGAGQAGRSVARHLSERGVAVEAFLDLGATPGDVRDGIPVFTLAHWLERNEPAGRDVVISLHNPFAEVPPVIDSLRAAGFRRLITMVDYANATDDPQFRYWLAPKRFYQDKLPRIAKARDLLGDETSRALFDSLLRLRLEGDYSGLPKPNFADQYAPEDLPRWTEPMRLIDCGAYDGDSIENLIRLGYRIEALAAFEPDAANYDKLAARFPDIDSIFIPCGVSDRNGFLTFGSGQGPSSRVTEAGDVVIQCVAIDRMLPSFAPTLIKMDVEGSEPAALRGAEKTLRKYRPELAISVYHEPDHLWEILLYLADLGLDYKFFLRTHGHTGYDIVLYCRRD